jgi:hypothetical protein
MKVHVTESIRKAVLTTIVAIQTVACLSVYGDGWPYRCKYEDEWFSDWCLTAGTPPNCSGWCNYVTFPTGTARCGDCVQELWGYCYRTSNPTMTTVDTWIGYCGWIEEPGNPPYGATFRCGCPEPEDFIWNGTGLAPCYCW